MAFKAISIRTALTALVFALITATLLTGCMGGSRNTAPSAVQVEPSPVSGRAAVAASVVMKSAEYAPSISMMETAEDFNTEEYDRVNENEFKDAAQNPLSTFSIDVDKASYSNIRRFLEYGELPPPDAVRIEELINYFPYPYPNPTGEHPFSIVTELADCPWNAENKLLLIGIQGKRLDYNDLKPTNLVFLIDTSGSMEDENKLPLLKKSLGLLLDGLSKKDHIAIVAYAGSAGLVLDATPASDKRKILGALDKLEAGGSTAGAEGITLAYETAKRNLIQGGNNRVILCTDGDFNIGVSSTSDLTRMMDERRKDGIYLTICGFGMGNYKDGRMEAISKAGNGNYFYIDDIKEAEKVFVKEMRANMFTIAKDVKIQVEFNPAVVKAYRLIGYENRLMAAEDFTDDTKDAGELGAGHSVTALYELVSGASSTPVAKAVDLKYQQTQLAAAAASGEAATVKFRYKPLASETSVPIDLPVVYESRAVASASETYRWTAAVAQFGMLLRNSKFKGTATWPTMLELAKAALGQDEDGYRKDFISLAEQAAELAEKAASPQQ